MQCNTIKGSNVNGVWVEDPIKVKEEIFTHFSNHFYEPSVIRPGFKSKRFKQLLEHQAAALRAPFSEVEIKRAV